MGSGLWTAGGDPEKQKGYIEQDDDQGVTRGQHLFTVSPDYSLSNVVAQDLSMAKGVAVSYGRNTGI